MLTEIVDSARRRLAQEDVRDFGIPPEVRHFANALARPGLQVIAEIKRRSPSAGDLAMHLDPVAQAAAYEAGGAAAISVLTEPDYFAGSLDDLRIVREAASLPVLRKDFIIDPRQVSESRSAGADALLLIVAALEPALLEHLLAECERVEMAALVEVHNETEARLAVDVGARIIGVNNRDLVTFRTDLEVAERLAGLLPSDGVLVAESGVSTPAGAGRMAAAGYDAILVGEALVTAADPAELLRQLRAASP
ncbi:MAG: indole-3-glycerol phosphate synthase TrpC [Acidimicrobiia bacterium]|nr:indole-3-glycerol phosphate synthase TrpC [Acidimicrobiia bacterium]